MTEDEKKKKEQEDFNKLFDDLFKNNSDKDKIKKDPEQDQEQDQENNLFDDDFLKSIFNDDKEITKSEEVVEKKDDDFDWLKDLIDEIDQEEQSKKKAEQKIETPPPPPKPVKPSFISKLKDRPRAPKPPEHIRLWGSGKKIVKIPVRDINPKDSIMRYQKLKYLVIILMIISISGIGGFVMSHYVIGDIQTELCKTSDVILTEGYTGDKILINKKYVTNNGKKIIQQGYINSHISSLMYNLVKPGDKVIDIGSGFGHDTFYLARLVGNSGKIYAFEARQCVAELLESSIKINNLENIEVFNSILFSENIQVSTNTKDSKKRSSFGVHNIILQRDNIYNNIENKTINTSTLDSNLQNMRNISLININANGYELSIILGAKQIISNSPNIKIITTWSKYKMGQYLNVETVVQQLLSNEFKFWLIKEASGQLTPITKLEDIMQIETGRFLIARSIN